MSYKGKNGFTGGRTSRVGSVGRDSFLKVYFVFYLTIILLILLIDTFTFCKLIELQMNLYHLYLKVTKLIAALQSHIHLQTNVRGLKHKYEISPINRFLPRILKSKLIDSFDY